MMGFRQRRAGRVNVARRPGVALERLEERQLLTGYLPDYSFYYHSFLAPSLPPHHTAPVNFDHPYGDSARQLSYLDNDGKVLTGKDREGDEWQITVHGPGSVIVSDATPNDGSLDDDIVKIQLVDTDLAKTFVTGQVTASARKLTDGTVDFNYLIALDGVNHIDLNGFTLARTVDPQEPSVPPNAGVEVFLPGGVKYLSFHNIYAPIDLATNTQPIEIEIGRSTTPLRVAPTIQIDSIFNTVTDSTQLVIENGIPQTTPTVELRINGRLHKLDMVSATAEPIEPAGIQYVSPNVSVTGRTAIRATGITAVKAIGSLRNTTFSRGPEPFANGLSGLDYLGNMKVGGVTDALGVDVSQGPIGGIALKRGLGDPTGALPGDINRGEPYSKFGYPAFGFYGGLIVGQSIGHFKAGPAHYFLQTTQDPDYVQEETTNWTKFFSRPGRAMTAASVLVDGSSGPVNIVGDLQNSDYKTGYNYQSFIAGLEPERSPSAIRPVRIRGDLVSSIVAATYRPGPDFRYGNRDNGGPRNDSGGPGGISGNLLHGAIYQGSGFYARHKKGYLPPPPKPKRVHGVNVGF